MNRKYFWIRLGFCLLAAACWGRSAHAQANAFQLRISTETAAPGDTLAIKITAREFRDLLEYQFTLTWNPADLKYLKYVSAGAALPGQLFGAGASQQGFLRALWGDPNAIAVTLPDNTLLFTVYLIVLNASPGYYPLTVDPLKEPATFEASDKFQRQQSLACVAGGVRVNLLSDLAIDSLASRFFICNNYQGSVEPWVSGGLPPYQYEWFKAGNLISENQVLDGMPNGYYTLRVTDAAGTKMEAVAGLNGYNYTFTATGVPKKSAHCDLPSGCAEVTTSGGYAPYTYHWSVPGTNTVERCDLPAGPVSVTVTDVFGCFTAATVNIGKDTILLINADSLNADCRFQQKGGALVKCNGAAPYQYQWSNGGTTQQIDQLTPGIYSVTVVDAAGCRASSSVKVKDYGTFDWSISLSGQYEFGEAIEDHLLPKSTILLETYDFALRAKFPATLSWNTGTRQYLTSVSDDEFYEYPAALEHMPNGFYSVTLTDADGCSETRSNSFMRSIPVFVENFQPAFFVDDRENTIESLDSCVEVYAQHAQDLNAVDLAVGWTANEMVLKELKPVYPGLDMSHFSIHEDFVDFHWILDSLAVFPEDSTLFKLCFEPQVSYSYVEVGFTKGTGIPGMTRKTLGNIGFIGKSGSVHFRPVTDNPSFNYPNLLPPSCAADGYARIELNTSTGLAYNTWNGTSVNYNGKYYVGPDRILFALPGEYRITQGGYISIGDGVYAYIPPYSLPSSDCVWPGDASNDNVVNQFDLLYLALGMGKHFEPRNEQDSLWKGYDAPDWPEQTPRRHINFKHCDLDGNGWIEPADTAVLRQHWGKVVSSFNGQTPYRQPYPADTLVAAWTIDIQADTLDAGKMLSIPVYASAENILGMAFSISYDSVLVVSDVSFEPVSGWLGDPQDLILMQKDFQSQSRFDLALARADVAVAGTGLIGHLNLRFAALPPDSLVKTMLFTAHGLAITPEETLIALPETRKEVILKGGVVNGAQSPQEWPVEIYPNPVSDMLHVDMGDKTLNRLEILTSTGQRVEGLELKGVENQADMDVSRLPAGAYLLRGYVGDLCFTRFFVIAR